MSCELRVLYGSVLIADIQTNICLQSSVLRETSKYGVCSGPDFLLFGLNTELCEISVFNPNTGKCGPEKPLYLDTFCAF